MCLDWILQIQEIVTTGKLSKLEHFEKDEKVLYMFENCTFLKECSLIFVLIMS